MRVAFTGTQAGLTPHQRERLTARLRELHVTVLAHGGCVGADDEADAIAVELHIDRIILPSNRTTKRVPNEVFRERSHGGGSTLVILEPEEPLTRNMKVILHGEKLFACPRTAKEELRSGTWMAVRHARRMLGKNNVEVIEP